MQQQNKNGERILWEQSIISNSSILSTGLHFILITGRRFINYLGNGMLLWGREPAFLLLSISLVLVMKANWKLMTEVIFDYAVMNIPENSVSTAILELCNF